MSTEEYRKILARVDWYYEMADDHRAYVKGLSSFENARNLAITEELKALFREYQSKHKIR